MFAATLLLVALGFAPQESPLVGQPCPPLDLSHAVQGAPVLVNELNGRIAVLEFLEIGNAASTDHSLPAAQQLAVTYEKDARVKVVGIATAWPRVEGAPALVDTNVRAALAAARIYLPVMRDRDSAAIQRIGLGGVIGTPRTLLVDAEGIVRWHGSNTTPESNESLKKALARLIDSFWVEPIADLPPALATYGTGDLPKAGAAARRIVNDPKADPALKAVAEQIEKNLENGAKKLVTSAKELRAAGYPGRARTKLDNAVKIFAVVPSAIEAARLHQTWKDDKSFQRELAGEVLLENAIELLGKPKDLRAEVRGRLEKYVVTFANTAIAPRIEKALAALN